MDGSSDATQPEQPEQPGDGHPGPRPAGSRSVVRWIVVPAILGSLTGILVVVVPWSRYVLVFALVVSGLAWLLRVSSDWVVERAGPQRGVVLIGTVLFGSWLIMAVAPPGQLRSLGLSPIRSAREDQDPYALPPAGSRRGLPNLTEPGEPIDPVKSLRDLVTPEPSYEPSAPPPPPVDGRRGTARIALRLSSSQSAFGEGVILIADASGDGRAVHGTIAFVADGKVVDQRPLRVQGAASQIEFRLVGLAPGTHTLQARYSGSRIFGAADSPAVAHLVVRR